MKAIFKKVTTWTIAMCLAMGMTVIPASAANGSAPKIDDVDYSGKGKVQVEFTKNVKYKKAKVTLKDNKGKKYKATAVKKGKDELSFKIKKFKKNRTYKFKIKGVKNVGTSKFRTVKGTVKVPKKTVAKSSRISAAKAKSIALAHAGFSENQVKYLRAEFDYDDGFAVYEVEFYADGMEYDYEISARTGKIIDVDREYDDEYDDEYDYDGEGNAKGSNHDGSSKDKSSAKYIGSEKAIAIALSDAGLAKKNVRITKAELDNDDGTMVYEIEFVSKGMEYEYDIDAVSGDILKKEAEYDD